jgi:hypothetical protein
MEFEPLLNRAGGTSVLYAYLMNKTGWRRKTIITSSQHLLKSLFTDKKRL